MPSLQIGNRVQVTDKNLMSCLLAVGCVPFGADHISKFRGDKDLDAFNFALRSQCGKFETIDLAMIFASAWGNGDTWIEDNPDHPFAYAMVALWNRIQIQNTFRDKAPTVFIAKGKSVAVLEPHMVPHQEQEILRKIGA